MTITNYYVASDAMGSTTAILDEEGNVLERRSYDAFGEMNCMAPDGLSVATSPTEVDVGFQSQIRDETNDLYQMGYRWYNPSLGRWLSPDPIELKGGLNICSFAENLPNNNSDIFGLSAWEEWTNSLDEAIIKLENDLIKHCPDSTNPCTLKIINGNAQCCTRDSCIEQAKAISEAIGSAVRDVGKFEKANGISAPQSGWWGNTCISYYSLFNGYGDFLDAGSTASHSTRGRGLKCGGWQDLVIKAFRKAMKKYVIDEKACFSAKAVGKGGYRPWDFLGAIFQHHWVAVYGPHDMSETLDNNILVVDPWESGGGELYPKSPKQPEEWDR